MDCCNKQNNDNRTLPRMVNGVIGIGKAILHIDKSSDDLIKQRLDVCRKCEHATKNEDVKYKEYNGLTNFSTCNKCMCIIHLKVKVQSEQCPLNKWGV